MKYTKDFEKYWKRSLLKMSIKGDGELERVERWFKEAAWNAWKAGIKHEQNRW